jgi:hypothetical protein
MQYSQLPSKFPVPFANSAGSGYKRTIPTASQIGILAGAASLTDGFPPLTFQPVGSGGIPPFGQDFNGLLNLVTAWSQWQQAGGTVNYDAAFSTQIGGYPAGAIVKSSVTSGLLWFNTVDNNTTDPDGGGAAGWLEWGPEAVGLQARGYFFGTDTGSANAMSVTSTTPSSATLTVGTLFLIKKSSAPNTTAVTLQLNSGTTFNVKWADGSALASGDWPASTPAILEYDGTQLNLVSPQGPSVFARTSSVTSVSLVHYGVASGTNTLTTTLVPSIAALTDGTLIEMLPSAPNTTSVTLACNGLGAASIVYMDGSNLAAGELQANQPVILIAIGGVLKLVSGERGKFAASLASNGYQKLPSGLILQWGYLNWGTDTVEGLYGPYVFPIAFPTACLNISFTTLTKDSGSGYGNSSMQVDIAQLPTSTQFYVYNNNFAIPQNYQQGFYWMALGF